jgi:hypothetical protein
MKAVATALVLIVGAAVVLWYANTLNSWVLGGLIGGLAALLISIPISLTLFSYLSRRHDAHREEETQDRISLAQAYEYQEDVPAMDYVNEVEGSLYAIDSESWSEDERSFSSKRLGRAERLAPGYPLAGQQRNLMPARNPTLKKLPAPRANADGSFRKMPPIAADTSTKTTAQKRRTTRHLPLSSSTLSQHRSEALRAARREALRQLDDADIKEIPTYTHARTRTVKPLPPDHASRSEYLSQHSPVVRRASRQLTPPSQADNLYPKQPRQRSEERGATGYERGRSAPLQEKSTSQGVPDRQLLSRNLLPDDYPRTEPINRPGQSGRLKRDLSMDEPYAEPEVDTESLQKPLVRRAPYMYEDDPLRQELSQYSDNPPVRRSSRYDMMQQDDLEE